MASRSEFIKKSIQIVSGAFSEVLYHKLPEQIKNPEKYIFPPGAVDNFIELCTSCGDCIEVCPESCIKLSKESLSGKEIPIIIPAEKACTMCEQLACIQHCEPKALISPKDMSFPKIGLAKMITNKCLAYNQNNCMTCFDACPLKRTAIKMKLNKPVIINDICTGCGICENVCVLDGDKGIKIFPV